MTSDAVVTMVEQYFEDVDSLSRAGALASDVRRQCLALEQQVAAVDKAAPAVLSSVTTEAEVALAELRRLDEQRSRIEDGISARLEDSARLRDQIEPACLRLRQLEMCQLARLFLPSP